jgi:hypothetical protein
MTLVTYFLIYLCLCLMHKNRNLNQIFILKSIQALKINKYRNKINIKIKKCEYRLKFFLIWPLIDIYELYEDFKENRASNTKS